MKCIDCVYHYITPADKYPHCQFKPIADWKNSGRMRTWDLTPIWDAIPMIAEGNPLS